METKKTFDIVALGEILIDFTFQGFNNDGQRLFAQNAGGAPANVLVAVQKLGGKTAFIGKVGNDMHGTFLKSVLEKEKVNTNGLIISDEFFTTLAFVSLAENGERFFSFARKPGADTQITKEEINTDLIKQTKVFHIGSLSLTDEPARSATLFAVDFAKKNGCIISYDPNYRASLWKNEELAKEQMKSLIPFVDIIKISDEETELLTGFSNVTKAAKYLFDCGIKIVLVTLGEKGVYVFSKFGGNFVPTFSSKVVDTTGAGDSFFGGFLYQFINENNDIDNTSLDKLSKYAKFGNSVASLCIEKKGAIPAMPALKDVLERQNC